MTSIRIILSALLIGAAGWMMLHQASSEVYFEFSIKADFREPESLAEWERKKEFWERWKKFSKEHGFPWVSQDTLSCKLVGDTTVQKHLNDFVFDWDQEENLRIKLEQKSKRKEQLLRDEELSELQEQLAWKQKQISELEELKALHYEVSTPFSLEAQHHPIDVLPVVTEKTSEEKNSKQRVEKEKLEEQKSEEQHAPLSVSDLFSEMLNPSEIAEQQTQDLSDVFLDLLGIEEEEQNSPKNELKQLKKDENIEFETSPQSNELPFDDIHQDIQTENSHQKLGSDNIDLSPIISSFNRSIKKIQSHLDDGLNLQMNQWDKLSLELEKERELRRNEINDISMDHKNSQLSQIRWHFNEMSQLSKWHQKIWKLALNRQISTLREERRQLSQNMDQIKRNESFGYPKMPILIEAKKADPPMRSLKKGFRFFMFGLALCFIFNIIWEMAIYRQKI